jgi:glycosyltransferase involved in cell wall biosynthesis
VSAVARAVWVTAEPPDRAAGGGGIRQAHLLGALASRVPTDLLVAGHVPDPLVRDGVASLREVTSSSPRVRALRAVRPAWPVARRLESLWAAGPGGPPERWDAGPDRRRLAQALRSGPGWDLVCVEHAGLVPLAPPRPGRRSRWAVTLHNVASVRASQQLAVTRGRRQRWLIEREIEAARRLEQRALERYDVVTVCSDADAAALPGPSLVVPNGVDVDRFPVTPVPERAHVVLTGSLAYLPNVDGADWFVTQVWPRVRAEVPEATLELAGREPVAQVRALAARPGVTVTANPVDMVPHLLAARVAVVPLRLGSGTRLKALEAFAAARPVVGTTIGLEGLGVRDGEDAGVCDDAPGFASAVVRFLTDDAAAAALARRGRARVEREFGWDQLAEPWLAQLLDHAAGPGAR